MKGRAIKMTQNIRNIETKCAEYIGLQFSYLAGKSVDDIGIILISKMLSCIQEDYALGTRALDLLGFAVAFPCEIGRYTGCNRADVEEFARELSELLNRLGVDTSSVWKAPVQRKYGALMPEDLLKILKSENPMYKEWELEYGVE